MHCPFCQHEDSRVIDSRTSDEGTSIRRRRECTVCGKRFSTLETAALMVLKRSGILEPFSREKVISGVKKACQGRPVADAELAKLAQAVEFTLRETGKAQIDTHSIGMAILEPLRKLDIVAYLRFASVYSCFESLEDFETAIRNIREEQQSQSD